MSTNSLLINWNGSNGSVATEIIAPVGGGRWTGTTVSNQQTTAAVGATASKLSFYFSYGGGSNPGTCVFYKNGVAGNQSAVPSAANGMYTDSTHSDAYVTGDLLHYNFTMIGTAGIATSLTMQINSATATCIHGSGATGSGGISFNTAARFTTAMGGGGNNADTSASLTNQQFIENPGTAKYFGTCINSASSGTATITFNKNGSAGNGTVSSAGSGIVTDTTHTDSCVSGDKLATQFQSTSATGTYNATSFSYTNSTTSAMDGTGSTDGRSSTSGGWCLFGGLLSVNSGSSQIQAQSQGYAGFSFTAALLRASWDTSQANSCTIAYSINGSAGNQSVVASGAPGSVFDVTHTDSVAATNLFGATITTAGANFSTIGAGMNDNSFNAALTGSFASING